jgi:hypothetical protein
MNVNEDQNIDKNINLDNEDMNADEGYNFDRKNHNVIDELI